jgi:hypothetical protein
MPTHISDLPVELLLIIKRFLTENQWYNTVTRLNLDDVRDTVVLQLRGDDSVRYCRDPLYREDINKTVVNPEKQIVINIDYKYGNLIKNSEELSKYKIVWVTSPSEAFIRDIHEQNMYAMKRFGLFKKFMNLPTH